MKKKKKELSGNVIEAALPMNTSHDALRGHIRSALMKKLGVQNVWDSNGPWVTDVFPENIIYDHQGQLYRQKYSVTQGSAGSDPEVKFSGEPKKCHAAYMDSSESAKESVIITPDDDLDRVTESCEAVICLSTEEFAAVKESKPSTVPIKIIQAGWGASAYYPKEVLQRDGPKVFKKGTHMYWNHATETEEVERPEGDLNDLAAVLVSDAEWKESGSKGPGLYSTAKVFSDYSQQVSEKGPHIGVSINAGIRAHSGEAEGRSGLIADQFVAAYSTDFVTKAGAGGAPIVPALESDRGRNIKETTMTEQEIKDMNDLKARLQVLEADNVKVKTENAALVQGQNVVVAVATVGSVLKEAGIDYNHKVLEMACQNPTLKDGKVDPDWVKKTVEAFSEGVTGRVTGMGGTTTPTEATDEKTKKALESAFKNLGMSEAAVKYAVEGRV